MSQLTLSQVTSLKKLGVFHDYRTGGNSSGCSEFRRYNLIYGFNGTGKTIVSRVFSSLEAGDLNQRLPEEGSFEIEISDKTRIRSDGPLDKLKGRIAVFNTDFVEENIQWENGTASPVFIGKGQTGLLKQLKGKEAEIERRSRTRDTNKATYESNENAFTTYKRDTARFIGEKIDKQRNYRASELAKDYKSYRENPRDMLEEDEAKNLESFVRQEKPLEKLKPLNSKPVGLSNLTEDAKKVLETTFEKIEIEGLRIHKAMMKWVRDGLHYHREKNLDECLLCGNELSEERVRKLVESIDEERFNDLVKRIEDLAGRAEDAKNFLESSKIPSVNDISKEHSSGFSAAADDLKHLRDAGVEIAKTVENLLDGKAKAPNMAVESTELTEKIEESEWDDNAFTKKLEAVNQAIRDHNASHDKFEKNREEALGRLKRHCLASYKKDYDQKEKAFSDSRDKYTKSEEALKKSEDEKESILENIREHGPAADAINKLISSYLGHEELKLSTLENGYRIQRRGMPVRGPLSEGEKTAVAFCYFLLKLESKERKLSELIVVIDDPISSLDTKALNYAFNLIKASVDDAKQLVIMTHNLDFMNEIKKWLKKEKKEKATLLFLDARRRENEKFRRSYIVDLPTHLKDYESEYHYLFHLVLKFTDGDGEEYFYLMPNALRKVLEIFLAFRRPKTGKGLAAKIKKLSEENKELLDGVRMRALERLVQLESHSDSLDDLIAHSSMQAEETRDAARALLDFIKALDESHYDEMRKICNEA